MYILYKIMNTVNDKLYIGQTKIGLNKRWIGHKTRARKGSTMAIHNAIRKYGVENFSIHPIAQASSLEEANEAEKALIIEHRSLCSENGYNITTGGSNGSFCIGMPKSEEMKRKNALAHRKNAKPIVQFDWRTGELIKEWTGQKEARRHGFSGNIIKFIKSEKGYGYAYDSGWIYLSRWEEIEDKTQLADPNLTVHNGTRVCCWTKEGKLVREYPTLRAAAKAMGHKSDSSISNVLAGRSKSSGGYLWTYVGQQPDV